MDNKSQIGCPSRSDVSGTDADMVRVPKCASRSREKSVSYTKLRRIEIQSVLHFCAGFGYSEVESHLLRPLERQDSEDLDGLIVAADTGLLWLTCLLFDSEWL